MDRTRIEEFLDQFTRFASGTTTIGLLAVADRSGLLKQLSEAAGTTADIAASADLDARYIQEILSGLAAAGVVEYDPESKVFSLPPEHGLFLADESSPYFMGGWLDMLPAAFSQIDGVAAAVRHGGGVGFEEFGASLIRGIDRGNTPSQRAFLVSRWLPAVPGLIERLDAGINVADVGCGAGTAAMLMAETYPNSQIFGYDSSDDSIALARARAAELSNLGFHAYSADEIPIEPSYGLITTFDVVHDLADPLSGLRRIREALAEDGQYLMMEPNASSNLEDNLHPRGALLYGISALHCMTQSLAVGGEGLGAAWGRQKAEEYASKAGFGTFTPLEQISNRFSAFYLLTP